MTSEQPSLPKVSDVAALAGVSVPTVSKVLNNRQDIAEVTRRRVEEAIAQTGYRRRTPTRPTSRAPLVDVVVRALDSLWVLEVLAGAEQAAFDAGVTVAVSTTNDGDLTRDWVRQILRRRTAGVVLVVADIPQATLRVLTEAHVPVVLLDRTGSSDASLASVGATNWAGGLSATKHLLDLGHRRIGIVGGAPRLACSAERLDGYLAALRRAGVPIDPDLVVHGDFFPEGGRRGAAELLSLPDPPTAIFASSDLQALGVYEEARNRSLRVPEDLSVVGFDDLSFTSYLTPALTTVRQPHREMAAEAVRMVLASNGLDRRDPRACVELATSLVVRLSTCAPRESERDARGS